MNLKSWGLIKEDIEGKIKRKLRIIVLKIKMKLILYFKNTWVVLKGFRYFKGSF